MPCIIIVPSRRSVDCICRSIFLGSLFCSIDLSVLSPTLLHCLDSCRIIVSLEIRQCQSFNFALLYVELALLGLLLLQINFRASLSIATKQPTGILIWLALNLQINFERSNNILTTLSLLILVQGLSLHLVSLQIFFIKVL